MNAPVKYGFQVVAAGRLSQETEKYVFQAHATQYITIYINSNCYVLSGWQLAPTIAGWHFG
jgi:hypothetical protein